MHKNDYNNLYKNQLKTLDINNYICYNQAQPKTNSNDLKGQKVGTL